MISADIIEAEETAHGLAVHNGPCVALSPGFIKIPQPWDCLRDAAGPTALCLSAKRENGQRVPFSCLLCQYNDSSSSSTTSWWPGRSAHLIVSSLDLLDLCMHTVISVTKIPVCLQITEFSFATLVGLWDCGWAILVCNTCWGPKHSSVRVIPRCARV